MEKRTLKNGLKVVYVKKPGRKVAITAVVGIGSAHERKGQQGISHFVEHMLFEGTHKRKSSSVIRDEAYCKGDINGFTSLSYTGYDVCMNKSDYAHAVDLLADILQNPVFDEKTIRKEKRVVLNEESYEEDEHFKAVRALIKTLYPNSPSRLPAERRRDIKKLTRKQIAGFYERYYIPNNMTLCVVGDVKKPFDVIERKFTKPRGKRPALPKVDSQMLKKPIVKIIKKKSGLSSINIGYHIPGSYHKDYAALIVIEELVKRKLNDEIRFKKGLTYHVRVSKGHPSHPNHILAVTMVDKKYAGKIVNLMLETFQTIGETTPRELAEAKERMMLDRKDENEDQEQLAINLVLEEHFAKAEDYYKHMEKIRQVNLQDIKRVSKKYFKNHMATIVK